MSDARSSDRLALALLAAVTLLRFWMSGAIELIGDEAYYWLWSKHLAAGYFSKPPGIAWAIALGTAILGDTERGVRLMAIACSALTGWGLYRLGRELVGPSVGLGALLLAFVTPMFWAGSLLMTIDALSVCAWIWAANALWAVHRQPTWPRWIGLGLAIGLGLLAKPTLLAMFVSIALWLLCSPADRRWLRAPGFWIMLSLALAALLPPLWWNAQNDWITFDHLKERGALDRSWSLSLASFAAFLGGQAGVAGPWLLTGFVVALARPSLRRNVADPARRFLTALWLPLLAFYAIFALNKPGQPNWPAPAWIGALLFTVAAWQPYFAARPRARAWARAGYAILVCAALAIHAALLFVHVPAEGNRDPFERVRGHRDLGRQIAELRAATGASFAIGSHYQTAALLTWYDPNRTRAYTVPRRPPRNQFDLWPSYRDEHAPGSDALYVARGRRAPDELAREFRSVEELGPRRGLFRGSPERTYWIYLCRGLREEAAP
jgi:4-amino-4-deoxy-L-arabinose transferase-like glycosyltransferase